MNRTFLYALAVATCLGTTAMLGTSGRAVRTVDSGETRFATDGAFRDGLFVGRMTARSGRAAHAPIGRWSSEGDRASFAAGYRRGYEALVAELPAQGVSHVPQNQ